MKLLAIETATDSCSVALLRGDDVLEVFHDAPRQQTEQVLPMVQQLLVQQGVTLAELDAIACGHGPGAFTGVRVAVSVTQGLAFAAGLPVIGVSTLQALALDILADADPQPVLAALDARLGELYLGVYQRDEEGGLRALLPDSLHAPGALPDFPAGIRRGGGSGDVWLEPLRDAVPALEWVPGRRARAAHVARLAALQLARGETLSAEALQPLYLRDRVIQGAVR